MKATATPSVSGIEREARRACAATALPMVKVGSSSCDSAATGECARRRRQPGSGLEAGGKTAVGRWRGSKAAQGSRPRHLPVPGHHQLRCAHAAPTRFLPLPSRLSSSIYTFSLTTTSSTYTFSLTTSSYISSLTTSITNTSITSN